MAVGVEGVARRRVPHPRLHGFDVGTGGDQQRRQVVPEVVEAETL
jgi:hypothetical protein